MIPTETLRALGSARLQLFLLRVSLNAKDTYFMLRGFLKIWHSNPKPEQIVSAVDEMTAYVDEMENAAIVYAEKMGGFAETSQEAVDRAVSELGKVKMETPPVDLTETDTGKDIKFGGMRDV